MSAMPNSADSAWSMAASPRRGLNRPRDVPRPESVEEVARWAGSGDLRSTQLVHAPLFWVALPLVAVSALIWGTTVDPGEGWTGNLFDDDFDGQPWNAWVVWVAVGVWLFVAVGVLVLRLSVLNDLRAENEWIFRHGIAYSIHRASADLDDGEATGWPTYIALDHRLDEERAARIHRAFELWLAQSGMPPSGSKPITSTSLFGAHVAGGYFVLHLPVPQTAGVTAEHRWILITETQDAGEDLIMTPVPVPKKLHKIRRRLHQRAARRSRRSQRDLAEPVRGDA